MPVTSQPSASTRTYRMDPVKWISFFSVDASGPSTRTWCTPFDNTTHETPLALYRVRICRPSTKIRVGIHLPFLPGNAAAISVLACISMAMVTESGLTRTLASTISEQNCRHFGRLVRRFCSSASMFASGTSARASTTPRGPKHKTSNMAAATLAVVVDIFGQLICDRTSCTSTQISNNAPSTRQIAVSQAGDTISRMLCAESTGPLHCSVYADHRHCG